MGSNEFLGYRKVPKMDLNKNKETKRIARSKMHGPHNLDVYSLIFGSLLGDSYAEKRGGSTRIILQQEESNVAYLHWFHQYLAQREYCSEKKPRLERRIGPRGKIRFYCRVRTYSFSSFNWIYDAFYVPSFSSTGSQQRKKVVPKDLCWTLLTPLALAVWVMDDGTAASSGVKIATHCFEKEEILFMQSFESKVLSLCTTKSR